MNVESRSNLAKLLATEDISVEHKNIPTAFFDTKNRVLGLPIWKDASKDVYDLLVGHEVGHALYTPTTDFATLASDIDPENVPAVRSFINVIEDARIEKKIKRKFPGLRKNFFQGYSELIERNFFGTEDREIDSYSLIDRINLHFKVGSHINVPFSTDEREIISEIDKAETFDKVLEIVKKIYDHEVSEDPESEQTPPPETKDSDDDIESDDTESSEGSSGENEKDEENNSSENPRSSNEDADDSASPSLDNGTDLEGSETQENFDSSISDTVDSSADDKLYAKIPSINSDVFIVSYKDCNRQIAEVISDRLEYLEDEIQEYKTFKKSIVKTVNYLAKGFELKKSASEYAKANVSKTGVIDTNKIHSYKFNDDLFRRVTTIPTGKSHGLLMFIDWSGSMQNNILDTIKQTITLATFCRKVNIPFEIYTFTDALVDQDRDYTLQYKRDDLVLDNFNLRNYLSSRMNTKEFDTACWNLFFLGNQLNKNYWNAFDSLGSTPLNDTLLATFDIYEKFKAKNNLEKVNIVYLTDGASNSTNYVYDPDAEYGTTRGIACGWYTQDPESYIVDPVTKHSIPIRKYVDVTNALLHHLATRYGTNVVGFFIADRFASAELQQLIDPDGNRKYGYTKEFGKRLRKEKSITVSDHPGYTELYVLRGGKDLAVEADGLKVNDNVSKRVLTTAFKKNQRSKVTNKVVLDNFIDVIS